MTEKEFNASLMEKVQFSQATTKIAVDKAQNKNVKEFACFELAEALAITNVLKELGTMIPDMNTEAVVAFNEIKSNDAGIEFDRLYIESQLKNHRLLRDLTEDYLEEAPTSNLDKSEFQARHLATLALASFKEHVAVTERISGELNKEKMNGLSPAT